MGLSLTATTSISSTSTALIINQDLSSSRLFLYGYILLHIPAILHNLRNIITSNTHGSQETTMRCVHWRRCPTSPASPSACAATQMAASSSTPALVREHKRARWRTSPTSPLACTGAHTDVSLRCPFLLLQHMVIVYAKVLDLAMSISSSSVPMWCKRVHHAATASPLIVVQWFEYKLRPAAQIGATWWLLSPYLTMVVCSLASGINDAFGLLPHNLSVDSHDRLPGYH